MTTSRRNWSGRLLAVLPAFVLALGFIGASTPASAQRAPEAQVCVKCHEDRVQSYLQTKHGTAVDRRTPTCTTCHGEGALEHAKQGGGRGVGGIINPASKTMAASESSSICLTCHQGGNRVHWDRSAHASADVSCVSCHEVHSAQDKARDKMAQTEVCFACHKQQRAELRRPSRHPIEEGKVACSDCHNPHGTAGPKQLVRDNVNDTCYSCHMEKRGPFVRSHQPVQEDCSICHAPHGTTTPSLLKVRSPFLCQSCHQGNSHRSTIPNAAALAAPAGGGNTAQAVIMARGCLNCHTNIHGTNNPAPDGIGRGFRR